MNIDVAQFKVWPLSWLVAKFVVSNGGPGFPKHPLTGNKTKTNALHNMNKLETKANRHIVKGISKQKHAKLTKDKLEYVSGKTEEILGRVQKQTSGIREAVKKSASGRCD